MQEYINEKKWLLRVTCICWIVAKLISIKVWTADRLMPTAPLFNFLDSISPDVHLLLALISIILIVSVLITNNDRVILLCLLIVESFLCCLDMSRWQPWEYQYLFIVFVCFTNYNSPKLILPAVTFILSCTYFYSGLAKLNEGFLQGTWDFMILKRFFEIDSQIVAFKPLHFAGYLIGIMELFAGLCLLFIKTRKLAAKFLIVMHCFILLLLGPLGLKYNISIWPWNLAMLAYLYLILKNGKTILPLRVVRQGWNIAVLLCWGILPALNFMGCWDNYLSSNMYSGRSPGMNICITDTTKTLPINRFKSSNRNSDVCKSQFTIDLHY